jgi:hypothetical protein
LYDILLIAWQPISAPHCLLLMIEKAVALIHLEVLQSGVCQRIWMRSQALFRQSRSLLKASATSFRSTARSPRPGRPRKEQTTLRTTVRLNKRLASSTTLPPPEDPEAPLPDASEPLSDGAEKPKRTRKSSKDSEAPPQLPPGLDIIWAPDSDSSIDLLQSCSSALPPAEIFNEALHNFHIALHPQTQHRATYPSPAGPPSEPTFALYCPIEGGDYVIDETVKELARRTNSEVVVLDSVHLAAGEWGHFGKGELGGLLYGLGFICDFSAANTLQLPFNPLHFRQASQASQSHTRDWDDDGDTDSPSQISVPSQMTLTVMGNMVGDMRGTIFSASPRSSSPSKIKIFFDELVNIPSPRPESSSSSRKPRIIYIRDFSTLASTSSTWYPPLLSAVRQRRKGAMSRPSSPISNPMTIVFGITPSLAAPASTGALSDASGNSGFASLLMNRSQSPSYGKSSSRSSKSDWSEDEASEKAREKRLRERLRRWEKGDAAIQDELPSLSASYDGGEDGHGHSHRPEIVVMGAPSQGAVGSIPVLPPQIRSILSARAMASHSGSEPDGDAHFFRTSVLVPSVRSPIQERECRVSRRREINELTIRMGIGAVGGNLAKRDDNTEVRNAMGEEHKIQDNPLEETSQGEDNKMWDDWGKKIEVWPNVLQIADRAVGSVVATWPPVSLSGKTEKSALDPTYIPWSALQMAWAAQRSSRDLRKAWMKTSSGRPVRGQEKEDDEDEEVEVMVDEVVEKIKHDPDLDQHEQRLLPCIVDSGLLYYSYQDITF